VGEASAAPQRETTSPMTRGHETVVVVEDEPAVRALMVRVLRRAGYTVLEAADGNEAVQVVRERRDKVDLLLTDVVMPQMDGRILASLLLDVYPDLRVLYVSGYATDVLARHGVEWGGVELLQKPFTGAALANRVREVLDRAVPVGEKAVGPAQAQPREP
jgi:CheY-like chemotaxis protein